MKIKGNCPAEILKRARLIIKRKHAKCGTIIRVSSRHNAVMVKDDIWEVVCR